VVENLEELRLIIEYSKKYDVRPRIGVRVKLEAQGSGRWMESAGSRSKFGLFVSEVLDMVAELREHGMLECLELLHCHNGSQVQDIRRIKNAVTELAHIYVELVRLGAGMKIIDIGGGVGVDYRGDQANASGSMNYTIDEFASDVVYRVGSVCDAKGVDHPTIVTECGRAMVAYSSALIFNVLGRTGPGMFGEAPDLKQFVKNVRELPQPIEDLQSAFESVTVDRLAECYHDAQQARDAARSLFTLGYLSLEMRALAEKLFWATCSRIRKVRMTLDEEWEELDELDTILSDVYFCNFSLFQSLPDSWAIDQIFPIMPLHRLDERPTRRAVLADVTCDSDGQIDNFIDEGGVKKVLEVHELRAGEDYFLGAFLVGAYQETLGDLHNLFGDVHAVHVSVEDGQWGIDEVVEGDTAREVLGYVQYDADGFARRLRRECERAVRDGKLTPHETRTLVEYYESGLNGYTYLERREDGR
jgi:arginine decarboxylase